jgi:hypothetical protein
MAVQADQYRAQAEAMRAQAASAQLENVRERCLRSAMAWDSMAERAERTAASRDRTEALKAAARAQESGQALS